MTFTEKDFEILKAILTRGDTKKGLSIAHGVTVIELAERTNVTTKKVREALKKLLEVGYVKEGLKKERAKTYILTQEGFAAIKELKMNIFGERV
ncbi:MAG: winged helix-turn-helix transcriptional regulator [Peptostreptococcaceae bacterium]